MLAPPLFPSPERRTFLSLKPAPESILLFPEEFGGETEPTKCVQRLVVKNLWEQCYPRGILPFEEQPLGNKPDVLSSHHHSFPSLPHDIWRTSLGRIIEHAEWVIVKHKPGEKNIRSCITAVSFIVPRSHLIGVEATSLFGKEKGEGSGDGGTKDISSPHCRCLA